MFGVSSRIFRECQLNRLQRFDVTRKFYLFCVALSVAATCSADQGSCAKELHDYSEQLAVLAYASGNMEYLVGVERLLKKVKSEDQSLDSCATLRDVKKSDVAVDLAKFHARSKTSWRDASVTPAKIASEIDWGPIPGFHAEIDKYTVDEFSATVASCNTKYPANQRARTRWLELFLGRVDYPALKEKADQSMVSKGEENVLLAMQLMGSAGVDIRDWSAEKCDEFARETPFDQLYAVRKPGK